MKTILSVILFVGLLENAVYIKADSDNESKHTINHPHKNEYASGVAGTDKHKYGYELKENKHFHHTTTEEDGVRLGCYGYVLFGKKYSTQYVADVKGYRPVFTYDLIPVYPKSGGERKASFVNDFSEDQQRSENIRYFFPEGCRGIEINIIPPIQVPAPKVIVKVPEPITPPARIIPPQITPNIPPPPPATPRPTPVTARVTAPPTARQTPRPTPQATPRSTPPADTPSTLPATKFITKVPVTPAPAPPARSDPFPPPKDTCDKTCCGDDESAAKLVLPVPLKNNGGSGSCEKFAKLVVPIDGLNPDTLRSLTSDGDTSELVRTILKSLA